MIFKKTSDLEWNIRTHNEIAKKYERMHGEIYNDVEQSRLRNVLKEAISSIRTRNNTKRVLDFGCGAGNLTTHLSSLGCDVLASDVSQEFLDLVTSRNYSTKVETVKLNGIDLSNILDESVDMVATYSVLHHVPDYLSLMKEFMRVVKKGGVIVIDHEPSKGFWEGDSELQSFKKLMMKAGKRDYSKYFIVNNYIDWFIRKFINPRYQREGDIHVFPDDHVKWDLISSELITAGAAIVLEQDYLLFRRNYNSSLYNLYKDKISDMHLLVARKI